VIEFFINIFYLAVAMPDQQNSTVKPPVSHDIIQAINQYLHSVLVTMQQEHLVRKSLYNGNDIHLL